MSNKKIRIMIVEDHPIFRLGLKELIEQERDLIVCGEAEDVPKALNDIIQLEPDMVIVDISLKGRNGIDLIKDINKYHKSIPVLVLSMHDESLYAERALHAGARGYIMKEEASESIVKAIRTVLDGKIYASEQFMGKLLSQFANQPQNYDKSPVERLTDRELEVFIAVGKGMTTKQIAVQLNLSMKTIGTYRERIKDKLDLKNAAELIRYAVNWINKQEV